MKKILIATTNKAKLEEIKNGLKPLLKQKIKFLTLTDVRVEEKPKESGKTFCENAKIKAEFYAQKTGLPTLADDGGLLIPYLNNEPGIKSRRWLGYEASDEELINYTLERLKNVPKEKKIAYLQVCLCFFDPKTKKIFFEEEKIEGFIAKKPSGKATFGYPFRALFIVKNFNKYYDELSKKEHQEINHRLIALKRLTKKILI
jgi:Xanthosine triphosphate pyrophosphatase